MSDDTAGAILGKRGMHFWFIDKQFETCPNCGHTNLRTDYRLWTTRVKITPHKSGAKGRKYSYGRIQLTVPKNWIGFTAWIYVGVPIKPLTEEEKKFLESTQAIAARVRADQEKARA